MSNYVTRKYHDKVVATHEANAKELQHERDQALERLRSSESSAEYWKSQWSKEREALDKAKAVQNAEEGYGEAIKRKRLDAVIRAHADLCTVKATETSDVVLQRVIGNVQGILAAVLEGAQPLDVYPKDKPPRRRHSDRMEDMRMSHVTDAMAYGMAGIGKLRT